MIINAISSVRFDVYSIYWCAQLPAEQALDGSDVSDKFTEADDPHAEYDFGAFGFHGNKLFWKLDLYNEDYPMGADGPADLSKIVVSLRSCWRTNTNG